VDTAALIESFITQGGTYVLTRRQRAQVVRGVFQPTNDLTVNIKACVQPATGKDLLRLPEGRRANETRVLFTTSQLDCGDVDSAFEADTVTIDGQPWEVQHVETFNQGGFLNQTQPAAYRVIVQAPTPGTDDV
jgi:hypothetical protein